MNPGKPSVSQRPFHQGSTQVFIVSPSSLVSVLFFQNRSEERKRKTEDGRKKERERAKEGRKGKKIQELLYIIRSFHLISDFKDGSSHHLVLCRAEL